MAHRGREPSRRFPCRAPALGRSRVYAVLMTGEDNLLIIIPAYNEQGRVGQVIRDVRSTLPGADVLVIDDGSADNTAAEAAEAGAISLSLPVNSGYGAALQTGY